MSIFAGMTQRKKRRGEGRNGHLQEDGCGRISDGLAAEMVERYNKLELGPPPKRSTVEDESVFEMRISTRTLDRLTKEALAVDEVPSEVAERLILDGLRTAENNRYWNIGGLGASSWCWGDPTGTASNH